MLINSPDCTTCLFSWYGLLIMVGGAWRQSQQSCDCSGSVSSLLWTATATGPAAAVFIHNRSRLPASHTLPAQFSMTAKLAAYRAQKCLLLLEQATW